MRRTAKYHNHNPRRAGARVHTLDALYDASVLLRADAAALTRRRRERLLQLLDGLVGGLPALTHRLEGRLRLLLALRRDLGLLLGEGGVALPLLGLGGALLEQVRGPEAMLAVDDLRRYGEIWGRYCRGDAGRR